MTNHRSQKQQQQVDQNHQPDRMGAPRQNLKNDAQRHNRQQPFQQRYRENLPGREHQDERQQIDRQRNDP